MDLLSSEVNIFYAGTLAVVLSGLPLVSSMVVGLVVSVLQAATQIQEQTLSFVPKVATVCAVLFFAGGWMVREIVDYASEMLMTAATLGR